MSPQTVTGDATGCTFDSSRSISRTYGREEKTKQDNNDEKKKKKKKKERRIFFFPFLLVCAVSVSVSVLCVWANLLDKKRPRFPFQLTISHSFFKSGSGK
jgi:hypothetical protein